MNTIYSSHYEYNKLMHKQKRCAIFTGKRKYTEDWTNNAQFYVSKNSFISFIYII
jgi:hypothetical protein